MKYKLNIEVAFTDKYTSKSYKIGDVIIVDEKRGKELLKDSRKLVSLGEVIEEPKEPKENKEPKGKASKKEKKVEEPKENKEPKE